RLAKYEKGVPVQAGTTPAEVQADFAKAQRTGARGKKAEAPPTSTEAAQSLADLMRESGTAPPARAAVEGPRAPTASEARIETLAQHLAGTDIPTEDLATLATDEGARKQLEAIAQHPDIAVGRPTADEIPKIVERVREIRGQRTPPPEAPQPVVKEPWQMTREQFLRT